MNKKLTLKDLNAENCHNLLQPIKCECGCGHYSELVLKTNQDIIDLAGSLLKDEDCEHAYIFALTEDNVCGAFTDENGIRAFTTVDSNGDECVMDFDEQIDLIKNMIASIEPHCIGVLQHTANDCYRIVMETIYDK